MAAARAVLALMMLTSAQASAAQMTCAEFQDAFARAAPDLKPQFGRSVVVSGGSAGRGDARDLTTTPNVEGRLICDGPRFVRFEAQLQMPSNPDGRDAFFRVQEAAAIAGLKWQRPRASQVLHDMTGEAAEYLRASEERGDISVAGKVEHHAGAAGDLGMIWTKSDRTFVVLAFD